MDGGFGPESITPKDKGYKNSWCYHNPLNNWINSCVTEFEFKEEELTPTDSGRKVTCKISGTKIDDGELYYCPELDKYFIFQNEKIGGCPKRLSPKERGYKYSWAYHDPSEDRFSPVVQKKLMQLRKLIFDVASATEGVGELEETLKWGQPSYLTSQSKSGSTINFHEYEDDMGVIITIQFAISDCAGNTDYTKQHNKC